MQQDVDTKRKGSHHITSHHISADGSPRRPPQLNSGGKLDRCRLVREKKKKSDALESTEEPSVVERFHAGKVEFILGFRGEERRTLQPPGAVLTLKITATNQSGSCTSRKTIWSFGSIHISSFIQNFQGSSLSRFSSR